MNREFFLFDDELWVRTPDKACKLTELDFDIISSLIDAIEQFYPEAFKALNSEYNQCSRNIHFFRFLIVRRFCKCNFGAIDNIPDIDHLGQFHLERVQCPLRGECPLENVVCSPKFDSRFSDAEKRVLFLLYQNTSDNEIAAQLHLSLHTIKNHIRNSMSRISVHTRAELMKYVCDNNVFKNSL